MNDRKQHVIQKAHQLFVEKGFQSTSIQDILDYSGIAKGTFYNYFSSKNELLIELFKSINAEVEAGRKKLLIGQDPSDIEIFIQQIELQMKINKKNKLLTLFEEVMVSNDEDLKGLLKKGQLKLLHWVYERFQDIFDEGKKPYLLDSTIMFLGILHHNMKYYLMLNQSNATADIKQVVRYSVDRILHIVKELEASNQKLFEPELLQHLFPEENRQKQDLQIELTRIVPILKKEAATTSEKEKHFELLDFIHEELLHSKKHRMFLIEGALLTLKKDTLSKVWLKHIKELEELIKQLKR
ncbi:TetR/AcrR family transcriptional regulator [Bacillus sp. PS06]|uniref:TetR/AcrR family transcriptional regulator n=1 Tax=Bacillus sp. PS06 TaxID=2764176 RepID=UPI0017855269|nr:TetR/AcrR family transcriptional regulator [Bacillus sp. PS06]MBD8070903.1 TetR/AcrR family transcriptional regulator [Bacillus sp. PS06]